MNVVKITARVECEDCGTRFDVDIDPAQKAPSGIFDAAEDALRSSFPASLFEDVARCGDCTRKYLDEWGAANPNKIAGISPANGGWKVTTYGGQEAFVTKEPAFDRELAEFQ